MILIRRTIPFATPLLLGGLLIGLVVNIALWPWWLGAIAAVVAVSQAHLMQWRVLTAEFWWSFVPALLWVGGGVGYFLFVVSPVYQWLMIAVVSIVYGVYTENVFTYYFQPQKYAHLSLPKLSYYMMIIATFFLFSSLYALDLINSIPFWVTLAVAPVVMGVITALVFRGYAVLDRKNMRYIIWSAVAALEAAWVVQFLPTSFVVNGALLALLVYVVPSIFVMVARDAIDKSAVIQYGAVATIAAAVVLATAQWV
jgi:hypothetical protein